MAVGAVGWRKNIFKKLYYNINIILMWHKNGVELLTTWSAI